MKFKKNYKKIIITFCALIVTSLFMLTINLQEINAHEAYKLMFTIRDDGSAYDFDITSEGKTKKSKSSHQDYMFLWNTEINGKEFFNVGGGYVTTSTINYNSPTSIAKTYAEILRVKENSIDKINDDALAGNDAENISDIWDLTTLPRESDISNVILPLTFPAEDTKRSEAEKFSTKDYLLAERVGKTLTDSLNQILTMVEKNATYDLTNPYNTLKLIDYIAEAADCRAKRTFTLDTNYTLEIYNKVESYADSKWQYILKNMPEGLTENDFIQVSLKEIGTDEWTTSVFIPYRIYKGYKEPSPNEKIEPAGNSTDLEKKSDERYITLRHVTMEAHTRFVVFNTSTSNSYIAADSTGDMILDLISGLIDKMISGVRATFGLEEIPDLVFGTTKSYSEMYNNALPTSWFQRSMALFAVAMLIALMMIFSSDRKSVV